MGIEITQYGKQLLGSGQRIVRHAAVQHLGRPDPQYVPGIHGDMRRIAAQQIERGLQGVSTHQPHLGIGRVMRLQRTGGARRAAGFLQIARVQHRLAACGLQLRAGQHAGAQQDRPAPGAVNNARLDADCARPAVKHQQIVAEFPGHMLG